MNRFAALALALCLASPALTPALAQPLEQKEKQAVATRAGQLLAEQYIYPQRARAARDKVNRTWPRAPMTPLPIPPSSPNA